MLHHKVSEADFSDKFDYVMVFPIVKWDANSIDYGERQSDVVKKIIKKMLDQGLDLFLYESVQRDELIVLITATDERLKIFADKINYEFLLDPGQVERLLKAGSETYKIGKVFINEGKLTRYSPYDKIYGKYDIGSVSDDLYLKDQATGTIISSQTRLKLLYYLLRAHSQQGGCNLQLSRLIYQKKILGFYPLHHVTEAKDLLDVCLRFDTLPWHQPIDKIRKYYGEKIAMYHLFLGHYTKYLILPAIVGLAFQLVVWSSLNFSHPVLPFFGVIVSLWSIVFLEGWKRKQSKYAFEWGMSSFESTEQVRPEFEGDIIKSYVDGSDIKYFPETTFYTRIYLSILTVGSLILLVIGVVAGIYYMRYALQPSIGANASTVASILNAVQIQIFNLIYQFVVTVMTDYENHRTDTQYQDSLTIKIFLFQFVNSYSSFFFIAFIAENLSRPSGTPDQYVGQCGYDNCMQPLMVNLAIIFGSRLFVNNALSVLIPYISYLIKKKAETKGAEKSLTVPEQEYLLLPFNPMAQDIASYADTAIEFGFMSLFTTALPCACFFSMVNTYVKLRFLAYVQATLYQRPVPTGTQDIGTFMPIFELLSMITVVTNSGLICFTMDVLDNGRFNAAGKVWIFIGFQWVLFTFQYLISVSIPDIPREVTLQLKRTEFITSKLISHIPDEDFSEDLLLSGNDIDSNKVKQKGGAMRDYATQEYPATVDSNAVILETNSLY